MLLTKVVEKIETHSAFNSLNVELNPIFQLLALLGAHHILHIRGVRVNEVFAKIVPFKRQCKKTMVEPGRPQVTIWRMRLKCRITKAINTHSEYVPLIYFLL